MKLIGSQRSPYVRKALVVAAETGLLGGIDLELHSVHLAAHSPDVMAFNPLGKIPTLVLDDGRSLFDSLVVCSFFARETGREDLWPSDGAQQLKVMQRHALANGLIDISILRLVEAAKPAERQWPDVIAASDTKIGSVLDFAERDCAALTAEGCTIGTLSLAVALNYLDFRFSFLDWRKRRPGLALWHAAFAARPSVRDNAFEDAAPGLAGKVR